MPILLTTPLVIPAHADIAQETNAELTLVRLSLHREARTVRAVVQYGNRVGGQWVPSAVLGDFSVIIENRPAYVAPDGTPVPADNRFNQLIASGNGASGNAFMETERVVYEYLIAHYPAYAGTIS